MHIDIVSFLLNLIIPIQYGKRHRHAHYYTSWKLFVKTIAVVGRPITYVNIETRVVSFLLNLFVPKSVWRQPGANLFPTIVNYVSTDVGYVPAHYLCKIKNVHCFLRIELSHPNFGMVIVIEMAIATPVLNYVSKHNGELAISIFL